ncbi:MAG: O-antigen ligase family protein [Burkholderiales bacterium]
MSLTGAAFIFAFLTALGLTLFRDPRFGLYTYLALFYLHPPSRWWGAALPDLRWSLVAAIVTLVATWRLPVDKSLPKWHETTPARLLIVFSLWLWIQTLWALTKPEHIEVSVLFTKYLILYYLLQRLLTSQKQIGDFLLAHVIGCGYLGWLALLAPDVGRLEGVGGPGIDEANALGMFVATGGLCAGGLFLAERSWRRWPPLLLAPLIGNAIVQSESRGAMLGLVAGGLVLLYLLPRGYRLKALAIGSVGLVVFATIAPPVYIERMLTLQATVDDRVEMDSSAESRLVLIEAQWRMWLAYPMGTGHRGTAELSPQYLDEIWLTKAHADDPGARSSHNTLMTALVEQGIIGLVIYVWLGVWALRATLSLRRFSRRASRDSDSSFMQYGACAAGSLVVILVAGMFTDYLKTEVQIWMYSVLVTLLLLSRSQASPTEKPSAGSPKTETSQPLVRGPAAIDRVRDR